MPARALYFTRVDIGRIDNGGGLCCRTHVRRLFEELGEGLTVVCAAQRSSEAGVRAFAEGMGVALRFVPLREDRSLLRRVAWFASTWSAPSIRDSLLQLHVDRALRRALADVRPDLIIVDYLPSLALCLSLLTSSIPLVVVTLNREADYLKNLRRTGVGMTGIRGFTGVLSMDVFERIAHRACAAIVAIGPNDLPRRAPARVLHRTIPPTLDPAAEPWRDRGARSIFFVGNDGYYPNALAILWLNQRLAPALLASDPSVRISIVGERVVPSDGPRNVQHLGTADAPTVRRLFQDAALLVVPIENDFGSKFKVLEAISFGTPIVATRSALSGAAFLGPMPSIDLDKPDAAAATIVGLLQDRAALTRLSSHILAAGAEHRPREAQAWRQLIDDVLRGSR